MPKVYAFLNSSESHEARRVWVNMLSDITWESASDPEFLRWFKETYNADYVINERCIIFASEEDKTAFFLRYS